MSPSDMVKNIRAELNPTLSRILTKIYYGTSLTAIDKEELRLFLNLWQNIKMHLPIGIWVYAKRSVDGQATVVISGDIEEGMRIVPIDLR